MDLGSHAFVVSPNTAGVNTFSATGTLDLAQGQQYWLVATQISGGDFSWLEIGNVEPTEYSSDGDAEFSPVSRAGLEFAITGTPYTPTPAIPEPSNLRCSAPACWVSRDCCAKRRLRKNE